MPHLRMDPTKRTWVVMAPERGARPAPATNRPLGPDPDAPCPLCPGNEDRTPPEIAAVGGQGRQPNQPGWRVRVVPNAYPALRVEEEAGTRAEGLFDLMAGVGAHEIVVETPGHDRELGQRSVHEVAELLAVIRDRMADLKNDSRIAQVVPFKNRGGAAGASLFHPHFQVVGLPVVPRDLQDELDAARAYHDYRGRCVYCDVLGQETRDVRRVVFQSAGAVSFCPFASRVPFECWVVPRAHQARFEEAGQDELKAAAEALKETVRRLELALDSPPFNLAVHSLPFTSDLEEQYHWHVEILPWTENLGGLERCTGTFINPVLPEEAAKHLRGL